MQHDSTLVTKGDLIYFRYGASVNSPGIVIDTDYRRDHSYLDSELWLLILFNNSVEWYKAESTTLKAPGNVV